MKFGVQKTEIKIETNNKLKFGEVNIETDANSVYDGLRSTNISDFVFGDFIEGKQLLRDYCLFFVNWVNRNVNCLAHSLARNSRLFESSHSWVESPNFVDDLLDFCLSCS